MEQTTQRTAGGVCYALTRRRVKNLNLRVRGDGTVAVSAPRRVPLAQVDAFVAGRAGWIAAAQARLRARQAAEQAAPPPDEGEALACFEELCARWWPEFAADCARRAPRVRVREMRSRWGSCSLKTHTLTFNTRLLQYPAAAREYVVVHEYCHFAHPDHSPAFWAAVARRLPDWKARRALLRQPPQPR